MKKAAMVLVSVLSLATITGCGNIDNETLGIASGSIIGGIIGHQFGGGSGQVVATIGGAAIGGLVGREVAKEIDDQFDDGYLGK